MYYFVLSFTHKSIDIALREKLSINQNEQGNFLKECFNSSYILEIFTLSTCNRVDFFVYTNNTRECKIELERVLSKHCDIDISILSNISTSYKQDDAIYHTFCVASALDSLVIGESQIVGQLKDAFGFAYKNKYASSALKNLVDYAIKCGAKVRNQTNLGSGSLSISSVSVKKAKALVKNNSHTSALVIGAGKMGMLAIAHLLKDYDDITLCNKNIQKAQDALSAKEDKYKKVKLMPIDKLKNNLNNYTLVFSATSANEAIITKDMLNTNKDIKNRYWFDLALPRDISEDVYDNAKDYGINVYSIDDLNEDLNTNSAQKEQSAKQAVKIVIDEISNFKIWLSSITLEPILKTLYVKNEQIAKDKLNQAIKKGYIKNNPDEIENIEKLINNINKKIFHNFSKQLRKNQTSQSQIEFIKKLIDS